VPYIGPTVTLALTVLFAGVSHSWAVALYVLVIILIIQEIENKALTPLLMKKFMDLPPVLVLLSLLVGGSIFGFLGTVFAVPVFGILYEFTKDFLEKRREESPQ
jgi:predicted PurR-regulated permease PerM